MASRPLPDKALQRIREERIRNQQTLEARASRHPELPSDSDADSPTPILNSFIEKPGRSCVKELAALALSEFNFLWRQIEGDASPNWPGGRGKNPAAPAKDGFFILLAALRATLTHEQHAAFFVLKARALQRRVNSMLDLAERALRSAASMKNMPTLKKKGVQLAHFPHALHAADAKLQRANRPLGSYQEPKRRRSEKHSLHGHKAERSTPPEGQRMGFSMHYPGPAPDLAIARRRIGKHRMRLAKMLEENIPEDHGGGWEDHSSMRGMLADKGHQGLAENLKAIRPKKKPPRGLLSREDQNRSKRAPSDRIIVERWFGCLCQLWPIISNKWRCPE